MLFIKLRFQDTRSRAPLDLAVVFYSTKGKANKEYLPEPKKSDFFFVLELGTESTMSMMHFKASPNLRQQKKKGS